MPRLNLSRRHAAGLLGAWGLVVGCGVLRLGACASRPSNPGAPALRRPDGAAARLDGRRSTLLIFPHPRRPCHVLLHDDRGELLFSGGITPGRGERGDDPGRAAVTGQIRDRGRAARSNPVFGCLLASPRPGPDQE